MSILVNEFATIPNLEVHLVLYGRKPQLFYDVPSTVQVHSPDFEFDRYPRVISTLRRGLFLRRTLFRLKPDAVLSFGERWNSFVLLATYGLASKIFASDRCQPSKSLGLAQDYLRKWLYQRATKVIAQTNQAAEILRHKIPGARFTVIGNPIVLPNDPYSDQREAIVLSVGRLIESKHHDRLIKIFHKRKDRAWKLMIAGDDALKQQNRERLQQLIDSLGEANSIKLLGSCKDIAYWYRRASLFAFTSSSEGFPNVILEALSYGLPVVSYNCETGPAELIEDGVNGYLVNVFDDAKFLSRLNQLTSDVGLRQLMVGAAREAVKKFSSKKIADAYLAECLALDGSEI